MHDSERGIDAYIGPPGSIARYKEYKALPGSPLFTGNEMERYIEAVTNERFQMVVLLREEFNFMGASAVNIQYDIDGGSKVMSSRVTQERWAMKKFIRNSATSVTELVDGKWRHIGFAFGAVSAKEDSDLTHDQEQVETSRRGKITIRITRGEGVGQASEGTKTSCVPGTLLPLETSKKVAVDRAKSHSLKKIVLDDNQKAEAAPVKLNGRFKAAQGKAGKPIEFTFFYASRMILELKKVIPKSLQSSTVKAAGPHRKSKIVVLKLKKPVAEGSPKIQARLDQDPDDDEVLPPKEVKTESTEADEYHGDSSKERDADIQTRDDTVENSNVVETNVNNAIEAARGERPLTERDHDASSTSTVVGDKNDDEGGYPCKKAKIAPDEVQSATIAFLAGANNLAIVSAGASSDVTQEPLDVNQNTAMDSSIVGGRFGDGSEQTKGKKRARLELELEEIRIKQEELKIRREEIKIRQRLMDLDD